jgi:hypothetical protein
MAILKQVDSQSLPWLVTIDQSKPSLRLEEWGKIDNWCVDQWGDTATEWIPSERGWRVRTQEQAIFLILTWLIDT